MNSVFSDPDIKVNMSLDEIIHLTRGQFCSPYQGTNLKTIKKKKRNARRRNEMNASDHSVPLLSSSGGVDIYVSKGSPLLNVENRRRISHSISNRILNSELLEKSKEIIPAEYKLIRTDNGFERILVPAVDYSIKPTLLSLTSKKLSPPRKLNKNHEKSKSDDRNSLKDKPPPLVAAPIFKPPEQQVRDVPMEVDDDDDIIILNSKGCKNIDIIDVESDLKSDFMDSKELCVQALRAVPQTTMKTLNDRFSMLAGNFHF